MSWSSLSPVEIEAQITGLGQPVYRARQIWSAIHERGAWEWDDLTDIAKPLRQELATMRPLRSLSIVLDLTSHLDGSRKLLLRTADGEQIETVLMTGGRNSRRFTVCVSSQVGCPAACVFCASGLGGLTRNLTSSEISDQIEYFAGQLRPVGESIDNVVFMGMGEPFLNYRQVMGSIDTVKQGLRLGTRRITVSTVGIVPAIRRFTAEPGELNLAVSLHAPNDALRSRLVPYNAHFPIPALLKAVEEYVQATNRRVSFEYVLLEGSNDSLELARDLGQLLAPLGGLAHVNLIPWNPFPEAGFSRATQAAAKAFESTVRRQGVNATIRYSRGLDIDAACGQLRARVDPPALELRVS